MGYESLLIRLREYKCRQLLQIKYLMIRSWQHYVLSEAFPTELIDSLHSEDTADKQNSSGLPNQLVLDLESGLQRQERLSHLPQRYDLKVLVMNLQIL